MSRKGKLPITLPKGIEVKTHDSHISVKGPKGALTQPLISAIEIAIEQDQVVVSLAAEHSGDRHFHGLYRSLIQNMVQGVSQGFQKKLEMIGVGYRAVFNAQGNLLELQVGVSHPVKMLVPEGIQVRVDKNIIVLSGADKQKLGQFAAEIRAKRPPEPYQGKGIRYENEYVRRKAGKTASKK